MKQGGNPHVT